MDKYYQLWLAVAVTTVAVAVAVIGIEDFTKHLIWVILSCYIYSSSSSCKNHKEL
ncbi:hypothetical protein Hanom_Chr01g00051761 [Helianthus anomalus]